jgi:hypothetical protein
MAGVQATLAPAGALPFDARNSAINNTLRVSDGEPWVTHAFQGTHT